MAPAFYGYAKPASKREDRKHWRRTVHPSGKRQVVIAMGKRSGCCVTAAFGSNRLVAASSWSVSITSFLIPALC